MIEQKIIFGCNHIISILKKQSILFDVTKSATGLSDVITRSGIITDVYYVYQLNPGLNSTNTYGKDIDYTIDGNNITWISSHRPANGTTYQCEVWLNKRVTEDYSENPNLCERCYGQGWYVDMMPNGYKRVETVSGINKLIQDFIKILYTKTQSDGYGTELLNLAGESIFNEDSFLAAISAELTSAALQLETIQANILSENEAALTNEEILASMEILSMEFNKEEGSAYVEILLTSLASDSTATMNFKF